MNFDSVWSLAVADGEPKVLFIGRSSGLLQKASVASPADPLLSIDAHEGTVTGIASVSGDEVYTCSSDKTVKLWNVASEIEGKRLQKSFESESPLRCIVTQGENVFAGAEDGDIKVFGAEQASWKGHLDAVVSLSVGETQICSSSYDNQIRVWDFTGRTLFVLLGHSNHVKHSLIVGNNVVSTSRDQTLKVWTLPADGDEVPAAEVKEGETEGDAEGATETSLPFKVVEPSGSVELPSAPTSHTIGGSNLFIGCTNSGVFSVNTKQLVSAVVDYEKNALQQHKKSSNAVQRQVSECKTKETKKLRIALKNKTKQLVAQQREAAAREAEQAKQATQAEEGDEEEPEAAEEAEPAEDGEEQEGEALTEELQKELDEFKVEKENKANTIITEAQRIAAEHEAAIAPLLKRKYELPSENFNGAPFTRVFLRGKEAALALAVDGANGFVADGAAVREVSLQIGVTSL